MNSRSYVARFNFRGASQQKKVGECSGGERNRIHLAKMLRRGGNLILLDEPTNDLDVATMRVLEQGLIDFAGCAMVISHDRFFLDRTPRTCSCSRAAARPDGSRATSPPTRKPSRPRTPDRLAHRRGKYKRLTLR